MRWLFICLAAVNLLLFLLMGADKARAKKHKRRIAERTLFLFALLGGSLGGCLGMLVFRHKTKHALFNWGFPLLLVLQAAALFVLWACRLLPE